jgi:hypothetical protein
MTFYLDRISCFAARLTSVRYSSPEPELNNNKYFQILKIFYFELHLCLFPDIFFAHFQIIHYVYIMILKEWNITIISEFYLIWYLFLYTSTPLYVFMA